MNFNKDKFLYFLQQCKKDYGEKIIDSEISLKALFILIDLGDGCRYYPYLDYGNYSIEKSELEYHSVLNIVIDLAGNTNFFFKGYVNNGVYIEHEVYDEEYTECFRIKIENYQELNETISYITEIALNLNFQPLSKFHFKDIEINQLLEYENIYIPQISKEYAIPKIFLDKNKLLWGIEEIFDKIKNPSSYINMNDLNHEVDDNYWKKFDEIKSKAKLELNSIKEQIVRLIGIDDIKNKVCSHSIFLTKTFDFPYVFSHDDLSSNSTDSFYKAYGPDYIVHEYSIYYVLKLKSNTSFLNFYDFLKFTFEGLSFRKEFLNSPNTNIKIKYIQNKFAQIQFGLENRILKTELLRTIEFLTKQKESILLKNNLLKKRLQHIKPYYDNQHKLIEMYENPLPFIIEKAFRDYIRSDVDMEMVTSGLHLLNILIKTRLFFPLEEYMLSDNLDKDFIKIIEQEFYNKKPSDGTFSRIHSIMNKIIRKNDITLGCFGKFNEDLSSKNINDTFNEIVSIRNRFAHPPYDSKAFMETLSHYIPGLIDSYRTAMADIDFLIPQSFKTKNKTIIMSAKKLMGFESKFETVEIAISQNEILNFEEGEFIAYNSKTKKTVLLSKFIDLKTDLEPKYNIGLFDGMENGKPVYR